MEVMPAPDFPTGGVICGYRGVKEAFYTGRGKILLRAVIRVEDMDGDRDRQLCGRRDPLQCQQVGA